MLSPLDHTRPLSTVSVTNTELHVTDGRLTDENGNPAYIGRDPTTNGLAPYGDPNRGVFETKNSSPTGRLRVENGIPAVEGHGTVTLSSPYREITWVGNANGETGPLSATADGRIRLYTRETEWRDDGYIYDAINNFAGDDTHLVDTSTWDIKGIDQRNVSIRGQISFDMLNYAIQDYWINMRLDVDWQGGGWDTSTWFLERFLNDEVGVQTHYTSYIHGNSIPTSIRLEAKDDVDHNLDRVDGNLIDHYPSSNFDTINLAVSFDYDYKVEHITDRLVSFI